MKKSFSLIELSVSLIVIGIIIAAVMSGRDVIVASEIKTFYQKFAGKWQTIASGYYDRMSSNLGDGTLHGGTTDPIDGKFDGVNVDTSGNNVVAKIFASGIDPCRLLVSNVKLTGYDCHPGQYFVQDDFAASTIQVYLDSRGSDNYIVFRNMPLGYAIAVDKFIDTVSYGDAGDALCFGKTSAESQTGVAYSTLSKGDLVSLGIRVEH